MFVSAPAKRGTSAATSAGPESGGARSITTNGGAGASRFERSNVPASPSTTGPSAIASRKIAVGRGQRVEMARKHGIALSRARQQTLRRQTVRFGHHDVDADRGRCVALDFANHSGEDRPRPWPLTQPREASLVDLDHRDRHRDDVPRFEHLIGIEPRGLQAQLPARLEPDQRRQQRQQTDPDGGNSAVGGSRRLRCRSTGHKGISRPSYAAVTRSGLPVREISS